MIVRTPVSTAQSRALAMVPNSFLCTAGSGNTRKCTTPTHAQSQGAAVEGTVMPLLDFPQPVTELVGRNLCLHLCCFRPLKLESEFLLWSHLSQQFKPLDSTRRCKMEGTGSCSLLHERGWWGAVGQSGTTSATRAGLEWAGPSGHMSSHTRPKHGSLL